MGDISGATVLITGAASGIGEALAAGFRADGAHVVGIDVNAGPDIVKADVANPDDVERAVSDCAAERGQIDVLINNAGIGIERRIEDHARGEYERVLQVNLFGPYYFLRAVLPVMREQGRGRVINMVSRHAEFTPAALGGYSTSKAALWALTRTAAREVAGVDILVNALIPGPTLTAMNPRGTQSPDVVYPTARMLATLDAGGPNGKCFWDMKEYLMYQAEKRPQ